MKRHELQGSWRVFIERTVSPTMIFSSWVRCFLFFDKEKIRLGTGVVPRRSTPDVGAFVTL